LRFADF